MKTFLEKIKINNQSCYQYGFDYSVSKGDDEYDFYEFIRPRFIPKENDIVEDLLEACIEETGQTPTLLSPYPYIRDRGNGDGYVKILIAFEGE